VTATISRSSYYQHRTEEQYFQCGTLNLVKRGMH
jgi:hypothetical protein